MSATAGNKSATDKVADTELLFDCVHCGLCLQACPTYLQTGAEMNSPRGRIYLIKALAEGTAACDTDVTRHLDLCLGCRGCETACPSGVRYGRIIEQARSYLEKHGERTLAGRFTRFAVSQVFPYSARLKLLLAPVRVLDMLHIRGVIARLLPRILREWLLLLPERQKSIGRRAVAPPRSADAPVVMIHRGCVVPAMAPSENRNSQFLLEAAGYRVVHARRNVCCGALDLHSGNRERALELARENVRHMSATGAMAIISASSGCSATIAEYGHLLKNDPELFDEATRLSRQTKDLSGLLLNSPRSIPFKADNCVVTYHDACHLAHGLAVREAPRALLRSIPGLELVELEEADVCCGSAGSYNLTQPQMAHQLAARKVDRIIATGAQYVILANPGCEFQINAELKRRGAKVRALHLADFLARLTS